MTQLARVLFFLGAMTAYSQAASEEMISLDESSNKSMYYQSIRCAALFSSIARWGGKDQLGQRVFDGFFDQAENLFTFSIIAGVSEGTGDLQTMNKMADNDLVAIGQAYLDRFRSRYATVKVRFSAKARPMRRSLSWS
jgi:hypothetical protein